MPPNASAFSGLQQQHMDHQTSNSEFHVGGDAFSGAHDLVFVNSTFISTGSPSIKAGSRPGAEQLWRSDKIDTRVGVYASAREPLPQLQPHTCTEVRQGLSERLERDERLTWLSGPAGTGRTTVMQAFAEKCIKDGRLGGVFFCSRNQEHNTLDTIIPTIAWQLALQNADYDSLLVDILSRDFSVVNSTLSIQFRELITKPFSDIQTEKPLAIIIDDLDACTHEGGDSKIAEKLQKEFIRLAAEHVQSTATTGGLLWFISSRSESHIGEAFAPFVPPLTLTCTAEDIRHIFKDKLRPVNPSPNDIDILCTKADRLPFVASTLIKFIERGIPPLQLALCLTSADTQLDPSHNPFGELDEFYETILNNVPNSALYNAKLIIAFCIYHPTLSVEGQSNDFKFDLARFLDLSPDAFDFALRQLHSVINVPVRAPDSRLRPPPEFFSKTFANFLRRSKKFAIGEAHTIVEDRFRYWCNDPLGKAWLRGIGFTEDDLDKYMDRHLQSSELVAEVAVDRNKVDQLSELRDDDAQLMVDFLSGFLDDHVLTLSKDLRKFTLRSLFRLTKAAQVYPRSLELEHVECGFTTVKAEGGFGNIYEGKIGTLPVCLKAARLTSDREQLAERIKAGAGELIMWAHLSHPNIHPFLGIYDPKRSDIGRVSLVSPWMVNGDLAKYLGKRMVHDLRRTSPKGSVAVTLKDSRDPGEMIDPEILRIPLVSLLYDIAKGLNYLHELDIVHGDLKAKNVYLAENGHAMIADFGTTRYTLNSATSQSSLSAGTFRWKAPEMFSSSLKSNKKTDIWAFGCICYEVVTGKEPFHHLEDIMLIGALFRKDKLELEKPSAEVLTGERGEIWSQVEKCCDHNPDQRPVSKELLDTFAILNGQDNRKPVLELWQNVAEIQSWRKKGVTVDIERVFSILRDLNK